MGIMKRHQTRLPKDEWEELQEFKKKVRKERSNKLLKDHRGRIYKVNENGSLQRATRDDLEILGLSNSNRDSNT